VKELNGLTIQFVVPEKRQDTFYIRHPSISFSNICSSILPLKGETIPVKVVKVISITFLYALLKAL
jgi:hypothetical protein